MPFGDCLTCPQPVCYQCSHLRIWARVPLRDENGYRDGWSHSCDHYPDSVPSECVNVKDFVLSEAEKKNVCPHFKRGAPQWDKPGKTA